MRPLVAVLLLAGFLAPLEAGASVTSAGAAGATSSRQTMTADFTTARRHASTGLRETIRYVNPDDRAAKPYAVRRVTIALPFGSRIDTSVPARCTASDAELVARGAAACPARSRVGVNVFAVDSGVPGPGRELVVDAVLLNNANELILVSQPRDLPGVRVVSRARVGTRTMTLDVPPLPAGPPDFMLAVKWARLSIKAISVGGRHYLTTPRSCPRSRAWYFQTTFTYDDGVTQVVRDRTPCR